MCLVILWNLNKIMHKLEIIDFFCGAGGFSEGFHQLGYKIVYGYDNWKPAIDTYNFNFNLNCKPKNILDFENSDDEIEQLPDTDVIIGSPPCVSFSSSNQSGKADKSLGLRLTHSLLRIIAIKKFKPNSILKAWFIENVTNTKKYLKENYSFRDLNLDNWASKNGFNPNEIAIKIEGNLAIVNSASYGSPQSRKRLVVGEIIKMGRFIIPPITHSISSEKICLPSSITLGEIKRKLPSPNSKFINSYIEDPLYEIKILNSELTDHFYDSGLYQSKWIHSKYLKTDHPYMGKMSFPENDSKPSRTITATNIGTSREAIIYKSEYNRKGDGEFRIPTVREAATIMSFPITFQFIGRESTKYRMVGNAVCPSVSRAIAKIVLEVYNYPIPRKIKINSYTNLQEVPNLNTFKEKIFNNPPVKKLNSRFRKHVYKTGNITVTLSNYDINKDENKSRKWLTSVQYGIGKGFPTQFYPDRYYEQLEKVIRNFEGGDWFIQKINNGFSEQISGAKLLQKLHDDQNNKGKFLKPFDLIESVKILIDKIEFKEKDYYQTYKRIIKAKEVVPKKQILALYAINKITTIANSKDSYAS